LLIVVPPEVVGNGQRKASFWKTVGRNYNAQKGHNFPVRTLRSLEGRWSDIKEQVEKLEGYYNHVVFENRSRYVDSDKVTEAVTRYNSLESKPFTVIHCWEILRDQPKWTDLNEKGGHGEDSSTLVEVTDSRLDQVDSSFVGRSKRPLGQDSSKATKRAASNESGSTRVCAEFSSLLSNMHVEKISMMRQADRDVSDHLKNLLEVEREKIAFEKAKHEERIMAMDLNSCNPAQRAVYEAWQNQIAARYSSMPQNGSATP
ncbi:hypothetical protein BAE44_0015767, partial [Dichanthelium oligosanthes]